MFLNMLQVLCDFKHFNILTTVKYYDELLRKVKKDQYFRKIGFSKKNTSEQTKTFMIVVRTLCARRERAVNTLQQLRARCLNVMDTIKTLWERRVDAVGTL